MDKVFDPAGVEPLLSERWEEDRVFWPGTDPARPRTFHIPPPNITGPLHVGHALNAVLLDVFARLSRLRGFDVLLQTGFDHAGANLERAVKKDLESRGISLFDLEREELVEEVWKWKARCEPVINEQLRRLGISTSRGRQPFTLDGSYRASVYAGFTTLHREGLVYRKETLLSWCSRCLAPVSDPDQMDVEGSLWQVLFEIAPGEGEEGPREEKKFLTVTTATPEALCCATAVLVHPQDERYADLHGRTVRVPLTGAEVPVAAHASMDPRFGSGAAPLSPGFSPEHFRIARELGIAPRPLVGADCRLVESAGRYAGLEMLDARTTIVHDLEQGGLVQAIRTHPRQVDHCPRCSSALTPLLAQRWHLLMEEDSAAVAEKIRQGELRVEPERWKGVLLSELDNPRPMLISRKSWWGIPVPAYYCHQCGTPAVDAERPKACPACKGESMRVEQDVLDAWFTAAFWPLAVFRWPRGGRLLDTHYPSHVLATDRSIVRSWILKMLLLCHHLTGRLPFRRLLVHGTVVDEAGRKMSKSMGNGLDPSELVDDCGADALRFALVLTASDDGDLSLSAGRLELARNFVTKVWNVARFALLHLPSRTPPPLEEAELRIEDAWILRKLARLMDAWKRALDALRPADAADALYEFVWHSLSDWYVEALRHRFREEAGADAGLSVLLAVLRRLLALLHPLTPFLSTHLWERLAEASPPALGWTDAVDRAEIPPVPRSLDENAERAMGLLQEVVSAVRSVRAANAVPSGRTLRLVVQPPDRESEALLAGHGPFLARLARGEEVTVSTDAARPEGFTVGLYDTGSVFLDLPEGADLGAEHRRLVRRKRQVEERFLLVARRLESLDFIRSAPEELVDKMKRLKRNISRQILALSEAVEEFEPVAASAPQPPAPAPPAG